MSRVYVKSSSDLATVKVLKITDETTLDQIVQLAGQKLIGATFAPRGVERLFLELQQGTQFADVDARDDVDDGDTLVVAFDGTKPVVLTPQQQQAPVGAAGSSGGSSSSTPTAVPKPSNPFAISASNAEARAALSAGSSPASGAPPKISLPFTPLAIQATYHLFINMHQLSLVGFMRGKSNHLRTTEVRTHAPIPAAPGRHARAHPRRRRARAHRRRREHDRVSDARARPRI